MRLLPFTLLLAGLAAGAHAREVYKCTSASGAVSFQDHACAAGDTATPVPINAAPAAAPATAAEPVGPVEPLVRAAAPPQARHEPPAMWLCTRPEDGKQYMSSDGAPPTRMVPGGVLGMPGKSLGTAYGRGGIGVSAPGVRKIPVSPAPQDAAAADYVAVQDQCEAATKEVTCNYLQEQYDQVRAKLRHAFKDEQALLQPQLDTLDAQLDGC